MKHTAVLNCSGLISKETEDHRETEKAPEVSLILKIAFSFLPGTACLFENVIFIFGNGSESYHLEH